MSIPVIHVAGVGPKTAELLIENKIKTVDALIKAGEEKLTSIPGIGAIRAKAFIKAAQSLVGTNTIQAEEKADITPQKPLKKTPKKKSKDKKGKKKHKKKDKKKDKKKTKKEDAKKSKKNKKKNKNKKKGKKKKK